MLYNNDIASIPPRSTAAIHRALKKKKERKGIGIFELTEHQSQSCTTAANMLTCLFHIDKHDNLFISYHKLICSVIIMNHYMIIMKNFFLNEYECVFNHHLKKHERAGKKNLCIFSTSINYEWMYKYKGSFNHYLKEKEKKIICIFFVFS